MFVGITGKSGAGKSFLTERLAQKSDKFCVLELDSIMIFNLYKKLQKECKKIGKVQSFIPRLTIDFLSYLFHKNPSFLKAYKKIFDKLIQKKIKENPNKIYIFDSVYLPILPDYLNKCHITIYVTADKKLREERILARGYNTTTDINIREKASQFLKFDNLNFDYVLDTSNISQDNYNKALLEIFDLINKKANMLNKNNLMKI